MSDAATAASQDVRAVLLDIEGTTTSISFVYDVLFPFARDHARPFLLENASNPDVQRLAAALTDGESSRSSDIDAVVARIHELMDRDQKVTALKTLQGLIWEAGYREGTLKGDVFPDVPEAFRRWRAAGKRLAIFSSGSILAQRLLFGHTPYGDLSGFIDAFFDTTTGPKRLADSYRTIASSLRLRCGDVLFASDVVDELDAAAGAGMKTVLTQRPGNPPVRAGHGHRIVADFGDLPGQA